MKAPKKYKGKRLIFEEIRRSTSIWATEQGAHQELEEIRDCHKESYGWIEIKAWIEAVQGGFKAVRHHAKYK